MIRTRILRTQDLGFNPLESQESKNNDDDGRKIMMMMDDASLIELLNSPHLEQVDDDATQRATRSLHSSSEAKWFHADGFQHHQRRTLQDTQPVTPFATKTPSSRSSLSSPSPISFSKTSSSTRSSPSAISSSSVGNI